MALDLTKEQIKLVDFYQITLTTGTVLYLTPYGDLYTKLVIAGNTYTVVPINRSRAQYHTDLQVDIIRLKFGIHSFTTSDKTIVQAVKLGWFDGADITVGQVDPNNIANTRTVFVGTVRKGIKFNRNEIELSASNILDLLKKELPKLVYTEQCNHKLFDAQCRLVKADFEETAAADASSDAGQIYDTIFDYSAHASGYWVQGEIEMTSGENNGQKRIIRTHNDGNIVLYDNFDFTLNVGDTFKAHPGCDKSGTTCDTRFSNIINFFGFESVPRPEQLY